jgi:hypothetical protein
MFRLLYLHLIQRLTLRLKAIPKKKRRLLKFSTDSVLDEEDLEIKRLEKLLGVRESGQIVVINFSGCLRF